MDSPVARLREDPLKPTERLPPVAHYETTGLRLFTSWECKSCPIMLGHKKEWQNGDDLIPGGFVVHMVISDVPGVRLNREICFAFKTAWQYVNLSRSLHDLFLLMSIMHSDCVIKGLISINMQEISKLFWDLANKKMWVNFHYFNRIYHWYLYS